MILFLLSLLVITASSEIAWHEGDWFTHDVIGKTYKDSLKKIKCDYSLSKIDYVCDTGYDAADHKYELLKFDAENSCKDADTELKKFCKTASQEDCDQASTKAELACEKKLTKIDEDYYAVVERLDDFCDRAYAIYDADCEKNGGIILPSTESGSSGVSVNVEKPKVPVKGSGKLKINIGGDAPVKISKPKTTIKINGKLPVKGSKAKVTLKDKGKVKVGFKVNGKGGKAKVGFKVKGKGGKAKVGFKIKGKGGKTKVTVKTKGKGGKAKVTVKAKGKGGKKPMRKEVVEPEYRVPLRKFWNGVNAFDFDYSPNF